MSTPNSVASNAASLAQKTALQAAANAQFISQTEIAIANAIDQGLYWVVLTTFEHCKILDLQTYYLSLGYHVWYPDLLNPNLNPWNPSELFGDCWVDYWNRGRHFPHLENPVRIKLTWKKP